MKSALLWLLSLAIVFGAVRITRALDLLYYVPDDRNYGDPSRVDLKFEDMMFPSGDGTMLSGRLIFSKDNKKGSILVIHGNAANLTLHERVMYFLAKAGFDIFLFDYRGYGKSDGRVSRSGTIRDAEAALEFLVSRNNGEPVGVFGQSIGAAIALRIVPGREGVEALVAQSGFTSYRSIAEVHLRKLFLMPFLSIPFSFLIAPGEDPIDVLHQISVPTLVVHGSEEEIVPLAMSEEIYRKLPGEGKEFLIIKGARHNDIFHSEECRHRVVEFFERHLKI